MVGSRIPRFGPLRPNAGRGIVIDPMPLSRWRAVKGQVRVGEACVSLARSVESFSAKERIVHYREMAKEVARQAHELRFPEAESRLLKLAESWLALAEEIERMAAARQSESTTTGSDRERTP
jgi:hypothetical protein